METNDIILEQLKELDKKIDRLKKSGVITVDDQLKIMACLHERDKTRALLDKKSDKVTGTKRYIYQ